MTQAGSGRGGGLGPGSGSQASEGLAVFERSLVCPVGSPSRDRDPLRTALSLCESQEPAWTLPASPPVLSRGSGCAFPPVPVSSWGRVLGLALYLQRDELQIWCRERGAGRAAVTPSVGRHRSPPGLGSATSRAGTLELLPVSGKSFLCPPWAGEELWVWSFQLHCCPLFLPTFPPHFPFSFSRHL